MPEVEASDKVVVKRERRCCRCCFWYLLTLLPSPSLCLPSLCPSISLYSTYTRRKHRTTAVSSSELELELVRSWIGNRPCFFITNERLVASLDYLHFSYESSLSNTVTTVILYFFKVIVLDVGQSSKT